MDLKGKVAIVTGSAQGIGKIYCTALLENGCKVCVSDVNEERGRNTAQEFGKLHQNRVIFVKCDVTLLDDFKGLFEKTIEAFGRVDILVNNAGFANEHEWEKIVNVNFKAVVHGIKLAFQYMGKDKGGLGGAVVNTASMAAIFPLIISPVYTASKYAVVGLTRCYGSKMYFNTTGVTVGAVCPAGVDTEMSQSIEKNTLVQGKGTELLSRIKMLPPSYIGNALIKILKDGKNGAILKAAEDEILAYEEYEEFDW